MNTANGLGVSTAALVTRMDAPIGDSVGNALEVAEAVRCLRGHGAADLVELVTALGGRLVALTGRGTAQEGAEMVARTLTDGSALEKFEQMLVAQGVSEGDARELCHGDVWSVLTAAPTIEEVCADGEGKSLPAPALALVPEASQFPRQAGRLSHCPTSGACLLCPAWALMLRRNNKMTKYVTAVNVSIAI